MADDHTTQAIGVYGSRLASLNPTPNIDALAHRGMRFDRVFCNNSICTPSRASIITGQYSQTNGVLDLTGNIPPEKQHLPRELGAAGYHTAMVGKWHLKQEPAAFDFYSVLPGQGKYFSPQFRTQGDLPWPKNVIQKRQQHSSDAVTDISLNWLANDWDRDRPFFLMHHFKAPHDMFQNAPRYDDYLEDIDIPEPENLRNQPAEGFGSVASRGYGSGLTKGHENWKLGKRLQIDQTLQEPDYSSAVYQKYLKRYLRCVKGVDDNVGRIVDYLKECGEFNNTIIFYTGDQGFFLGEHDLMDKRWMYEEAMRMPLIVSYPDRISAGSKNSWLINNTDFAPTMLEISGLPTPAYMQGRSFYSALEGAAQPQDWRTATYYRYWMHMAHNLRVPAHFGIRTVRYKLMFFYGCTPNGDAPTPAAWELYDLQQDPHEMQNQFSNPEYKAILEQLGEQLWKIREELDETDAAYPAVQAIIDAHRFD